jgi:hypothetical protein
MTAVRLHTPALHRGPPSRSSAASTRALIAVAAYATPLKRALGVITTEHEGSRMLYRVTGRDEAIVTLDEAAHLATQWRTARDCGG